MADKVVTIKEKVFDIKGTTKLVIGDPWYFEQIEAGSKNKNLKKLTFNGNIMTAAAGKLRVRLNKVNYESEYGDGEYKTIDVTVAQSSVCKELEVYMQGRYFPAYLKEEHQLGCDTARFEMTTKYGSDLFNTGGDGYYGDIYQMKKGHGMLLNLSFDTDMFDYDEVVDRMLKLFPESKNKKTEMR